VRGRRTAQRREAAAKRFAPDLRDVYQFHRALAGRWKGRVQACEPWNEADISMFGGHTGAEMAAFQKAAYLGLKAGDPAAIACLNVFAVERAATLEDLAANEAWPYFDTCNLHHYVVADRYPAWYAAFRRISAGRPLWVTEFCLPVQWSGDPAAQEPSDADLRLQAQRVPLSFAAVLHEGPAAAFYFLFPHYVEGKIQFGIVRRDLTPRPAYVALAAAGRLLADARPLGRATAADARVRAYLFAARPDGVKREVLVAWTTAGAAALDLPVAPAALFDHLGRPLPAPADARLALSVAPVYALFPPGTAGRMQLAAPPAPAGAPPVAIAPSPIVLQALWPAERSSVDASAYRLTAGGAAQEVPLFAYNFSAEPATGSLHVDAPAGWSATAPQPLELAAGERKELRLRVTAGEGGAAGVVTVRGDFGRQGRPVVAVRFVVERPASRPQ